MRYPDHKIDIVRKIISKRGLTRRKIPTTEFYRGFPVRPGSSTLASRYANFYPKIE